MLRKFYFKYTTFYLKQILANINNIMSLKLDVMLFWRLHHSSHSSDGTIHFKGHFAKGGEDGRREGHKQ